MPIQLHGDDKLVVLFKHMAFENEGKTASEGRPVFDDWEVCEIHIPGSKDVKVFPATTRSHWSGDIYGGNQVEVTYAERFQKQYQQFKAQQAQTMSGTPLQFVPFLTEARRAELRAQNVYTVEQLAAMDGQELKNLGINGREMKNNAEAFLAEAKANAPHMRLAAELEQMKARNTVLEQDMLALKASKDEPDGEFANMSLDQLRDFITEQTGHRPVGVENMGRKVLERMAKNSQQKVA